MVDTIDDIRILSVLGRNPFLLYADWKKTGAMSANKTQNDPHKRSTTEGTAKKNRNTSIYKGWK